MYLVAFLITYMLFRYQVNRDPLRMSEDDINGLFFWTILGLLLGARLFAALVYDTSGIYLRRPWLIFWPFDAEMNFTGLQGMSYHGGVIGAVIGGYLYCRRRGYRFLRIADLMVTGIPLGYTFGRLGNFINGELWGRVTASPIGMIFPQAPGFSTRKEWVRRVADKVGISHQPGEVINLPRHPSQLYEAFFEGIVLWLLMWFVFRRRVRRTGGLLGIYLIGYGIIRFLIEYVREPDAGIGFPISFAEQSQPQALFLSPWNFTTGQILNAVMVLGGLALLWWSRRRAARDSGG
jgi:phosphatidylglycerol:prolipoprotein diacylglycerol transferase